MFGVVGEILCGHHEVVKHWPTTHRSHDSHLQRSANISGFFDSSASLLQTPEGSKQVWSGQPAIAQIMTWGGRLKKVDEQRPRLGREFRVGGYVSSYLTIFTACAGSWTWFWNGSCPHCNHQQKNPFHSFQLNNDHDPTTNPYLCPPAISKKSWHRRFHGIHPISSSNSHQRHYVVLRIVSQRFMSANLPFFGLPESGQW